MISIAIFNNKGGVGKTSLLCNLAAYLKVRLNKRVLIVDADPQCNATIYVTPEEDLEEIYNDKKQCGTIFDIVNPLKEGDGFLSKDKLPICTSKGFECDVIFGDTRLSLMEDFLSGDWVAGKEGQMRGLKTTFLFWNMLQKIKDDYDYVFFDVGPSLGAINRSVLLACDYFIMPMSSDIFSLKAVDNISASLKEWNANILAGIEKYKKEKDQALFKIEGVEVLSQLKFLGYIYQQYTAKSIDGVRRPVKAYDLIINKMHSLITEKLRDFYKVGFTKDNLLLGEIPTLSSLIPLSQSAHKPIFLLVGADGVVGAHFVKVKEYEEVIKHIVEKIKENLSEYGLA